MLKRLSTTRLRLPSKCSNTATESMTPSRKAVSFPPGGTCGGCSHDTRNSIAEMDSGAGVDRFRVGKQPHSEKASNRISPEKEGQHTCLVALSAESLEEGSARGRAEQIH